MAGDWALRALAILALLAAGRSRALAQDVTVTAPSPKRVPDLVAQFATPLSGDRLARWRRPLCPYVMGLSHDHDGFVAARIGEIAGAAGIRIAAGACDPNLVVVIAKDDAALRAAINRRAYRVFFDGRWPVDKLQLADFARDDGRPAHVFYVFGDGWTTNGFPLTTAPTADTAGYLSGLLFGPPVYTRPGASRLVPHTEQHFQRVVLVLNGDQIAGLTLAQIGAYAAMTTLAEVRVKTPLADVDTITGLFADRTAGRPLPPDLTFWDRAYLGALYHAPPEVSLASQRSDMVSRIVHSIEVLNVAPAGAATTAPPPPSPPAPQGAP